MSCDKLLKTTKYDVYCSNVAVVCIVLGVTISLVAFFYPVEWDFVVDPGQSAQENEDRRTSQAQTQTTVYAMSLTGVVLVTIGGILSAFLLSKFILLEECVKTDEEQEVTMAGFQSPLPPSSGGGTGCQRPDRSTNKGNKEMLRDGQQRKLVDSDYLQLNGASEQPQQYGSTR